MIKPGARIAAHEATELAEGKHGGSHTAAPMGDAKHGGESHGVAETPAAPAAEAAKAEGHEATAAHSEGEHKAEGEPATTPHSEPANEGTEHPAPATAEASAAPTGEGGGSGGAVVNHHEEDESKSFKLGYTVPGLDDLGVLVGFLSLFLFFFFRQLEKASLVPMRDPYLEESLHHDTGALIEGEGGGHGH